MKNIVPKDTRYVPFTQQKSCCVPACISMIMYKLGIPLISQELLGYYLGLTVAKENRHLFWHPRVGKMSKYGYGTRIDLKKYNPNIVFKKLGIPLRMTPYHINKFKTKKDFVLFVSECIKKDKDILVFLGSKALDNSAQNNGHACVIDRIYPAKDIVRIIDPTASRPKWRELKIRTLMEAMKAHPTKGGGFRKFEKISIKN